MRTDLQLSYVVLALTEPEILFKRVQFTFGVRPIYPKSHTQLLCQDELPFDFTEKERKNESQTV